MSEHTPGPWRWWTSCSHNRLSSDATRKDGGVLRAVRYSDGVCGIEGSEADMALVAAAPDLLKALKSAAINIASIGYPVGPDGRYHKDGKWAFTEALPHEADAAEILKAYNTITEAIAKCEAKP